jgi:hypothetical protein
LNIAKKKLNKIIEDGIKFNNYYYVLCSDCPENLLKEYDGPTVRTVNISKNSYPIKQINPITKEELIFNTYDEISVKLGFKARTIKNAIVNKTMYGGSIWKHCKDGKDIEIECKDEECEEACEEACDEECDEECNEECNEKCEEECNEKCDEECEEECDEEKVETKEKKIKVKQVKKEKVETKEKKIKK